MKDRISRRTGKQLVPVYDYERANIFLFAGAQLRLGLQWAMLTVLFGVFT